MSQPHVFTGSTASAPDPQRAAARNAARNARTASHGTLATNANVARYLEHHARRRPDQVLLETRDASLTCAQLERTAAHAAGGFSSLGIGKGDAVVLLLPLSIPLYAAMFALQRLGAIPVFLDSWARSQELAHVLAACRPKGLVTVPQGWALLGDAANQLPVRVCLGPTARTDLADLAAVFAHPAPAPVAVVDAGHTALVTFTTGSTGRPKGADRTHGFLEAQHQALLAHVPFDEGDADLCVFPIFSLHSLASGARTLLPDLDIARPDGSDGLRLLDQVRASRPTSATLSVPLLRALTRACEATRTRLPLRLIVTGGAPVSPDDLRLLAAVAPGATIRVLYGSTEVEPIATLDHPEILALASRAAEDPDWVEDGVPVGRLDPSLDGFLARLGQEPPLEDDEELDPRAWDAGDGPGELVVSGAHVCPGYYADPAATRRAKLRGRDGRLWHRTGDVVRRDANGVLWLLGRTHDSFRFEGEWRFPVRAGMALRKIPGVRHAAWLDVPGAGGASSPWAVLVPVDPSVDPVALAAEARRILSHNGIPVDRVVVRDSVPLDPRHHAKIEVAPLRALLQAGGDA